MTLLCNRERVTITTVTPPTNKIESVQLLRAVAALGVVTFHAVHQLISRNGLELRWTGLGAAGVDLFFVVSGFIMWVTALNRGMPLGRFASKRIQRIVPLYWLMTAIVLAVVLLAPAAMRNASHDPLHFAASFAFIAWPHPAMPEHFWPALVPGWSLNYEMFFYLLVGCALLLRRSFRVPFIGGALLVAVVAGLLLQPTGILAFYTNSILLEFLLGLLIGMAFDPGHRTRGLDYALCLAGLGLFVLVGPYETEANRLLTWGLPLALAAVGAINIAMPRTNGLVRKLGLIGDASYSIYLTQFIVLPPTAMLLARVLPDLHGVFASFVFVVAVIAVAVLVGIASYSVLEKPMLRASTSLLTRNQRNAARPTVAEW
jgi:exopolysaccharide production protein ExoZ